MHHSQVKNKPVNVVFDEGVSQAERLAVNRGIETIIHEARVNLEVRNFGTWRESEWILPDNSLAQWKSVDWYLANGFADSRNLQQVNSDYLLKLLWEEPWQQIEPHYDVLITSCDLNASDANFVIGAAIHGFGFVASTARFRKVPDNLRYECIQTEVLHEAGHMLGLVTRDHECEESLGRHCTNQCVMRQGLRVPYDWVQMTKQRLSSRSPFCITCLNDLWRYFA